MRCQQLVTRGYASFLSGRAAAATSCPGISWVSSLCGEACLDDRAARGASAGTSSSTVSTVATFELGGHGANWGSRRLEPKGGRPDDGGGDVGGHVGAPPQDDGLRNRKKWQSIPTLKKTASTILNKLARVSDLQPSQIVWATQRMAMLLPNVDNISDSNERASEVELDALDWLAKTLQDTGIVDRLTPGQVAKLLQQLSQLHQHPYFQQHDMASLWPWAALDRHCQEGAAGMRSWEVVKAIEAFSCVPPSPSEKAVRALHNRAWACLSSFQAEQVSAMIGAFGRMGYAVRSDFRWQGKLSYRYFSNKKWKQFRSIRETAIAILSTLRHTQQLRTSSIVEGTWRMASFLPDTDQSAQASDSELAALEFLAASLRSSTKLQEDLRSWQIPALLQPLARIHQHPYFRHHSVSSAWPWAAIERRCQATAADMSAQELARVIWAYSCLPEQPSKTVRYYFFSRCPAITPGNPDQRSYDKTVAGLRDRAVACLWQLGPYRLGAVAHGLTRMGFHPGEEFLVSCTAAALILEIRNFKPADLCSLLSAFALCGWNPGPALMQTVDETVAARCASFSVRELVNLMCSFAHLGHQPDQIIQLGDDTTSVLNIIHDEIVERTSAELKATDISEFLWASASLNFVPDSGCLDMLQERALHRMSDFSAAEISKMAWGLACHMPTLQLMPSFLDEVAEAALSKLSGFTPQGLSNLMLAYASFKNNQPALLYAVEQQTMSIFSQCNGQDVSNLLHAFHRLRYTPSVALLAMVEAFLQGNISELSEEELQKLVRALHRMGYVPEPNVREAVKQRLESDASLSPEVVGNISWSLGEMEATAEAY